MKISIDSELDRLMAGLSVASVSPNVTKRPVAPQRAAQHYRDVAATCVGRRCDTQSHYTGVARMSANANGPEA